MDNELRGVLFFSEEAPHVTGYIVIGDDHYELAGVRRSKIRLDLTGKRIADHDQAGNESDRERDQL
jgi:hypothetical protein